MLAALFFKVGFQKFFLINLTQRAFCGVGYKGLSAPEKSYFTRAFNNRSLDTYKM